MANKLFKALSYLGEGYSAVTNPIPWAYDKVADKTPLPPVSKIPVVGPILGLPSKIIDKTIPPIVEGVIGPRKPRPRKPRPPRKPPKKRGRWPRRPSMGEKRLRDGVMIQRSPAVKNQARRAAAGFGRRRYPGR